jgi:hypothetical protein
LSAIVLLYAYVFYAVVELALPRLMHATPDKDGGASYWTAMTLLAGMATAVIVVVWHALMSHLDVSHELRRRLQAPSS